MRPIYDNYQELTCEDCGKKRIEMVYCGNKKRRCDECLFKVMGISRYSPKPNKQNTLRLN